MSRGLTQPFGLAFISERRMKNTKHGLSERRENERDEGEVQRRCCQKNHLGW